ncbi:hypothetical protein C8J57DRAFT_1506586 [Mycena rebaudengoi]|nr:hypothetical protein C8J57DRAFT_1506586 [Mycena rebaudengoi]
MSLFFSTATNLPPTPKIPSSSEDHGWDRCFPPLARMTRTHTHAAELRAPAPCARHNDQQPLHAPGTDAHRGRHLYSQYDSPGVVTACSSMPSGVNSVELLCAVSLLRHLQLQIRDSRLQVTIWRGVSASMAPLRLGHHVAEGINGWPPWGLARRETRAGVVDEAETC